MKYVREGEVLVERCYIGGIYCVIGERVWSIEIGGKEEFHREDGPAYINHYEDGKVWREYYYINGNRHRECGPARIYYNENGKVDREEYYLNGEYLFLVRVVSKSNKKAVASKFKRLLKEYRMKEIYK